LTAKSSQKLTFDLQKFEHFLSTAHQFLHISIKFSSAHLHYFFLINFAQIQSKNFDPLFWVLNFTGRNSRSGFNPAAEAMGRDAAAG